ncbi:MAG: alanine racemase [Flavobacteriales bacterium]|nr:alanine racemase [Flavobacteriales bacterium]
MAELIIETEKIRENILNLSKYFDEHNTQWSLITKVFSGEMDFLRQILTDDIIQNLNTVGDSRLTSLKNLRSVRPDLRTIYIKPPARVYASDVVEYADISLNSSLGTLEALDQAAQHKNKEHKVIIMIELGELREGVNRSDIVDFFEQALRFKHIEIIGIGSNLGCMYGVEPTYDKLMQLKLYKELLENRFSISLPIVSGGSSITLPLIDQGAVPPEINHFRIGEAAFFGLSPLDNQPFENLHTHTFELAANIIEIEEKKVLPDGHIGDANVGHTANLDAASKEDTSVKAILDFGLIDVAQEDIEPIDKSITFVGITSDMLVVDLGPAGEKKYQIGDQVRFAPNYMAVARLLHSKFIDQVFV